MKTRAHRVSRRDAWQEAAAAGVDVSLLEANLRLTPWQRIQRHSRALETVRLLRTAMESRHGRT